MKAVSADADNFLDASPAGSQASNAETFTPYLPAWAAVNPTRILRLPPYGMLVIISVVCCSPVRILLQDTATIISGVNSLRNEDVVGEVDITIVQISPALD